MILVSRSSLALAVVVAALAAPNVASAHVGKNAPVATNFTARVTHPIPGVRVEVVDGDQTLWLDAGAHAVAIRGIQGEPLLRFDGRGVWLNLRSLTAQIDRIDRYSLQPDPNPHAQPLWHRLSGGTTYRWHDHRLHILEPVARGRTTPATLGAWTIPLVVDGHRETLAGVLDYRPPPSPVIWIGITVLLAAAGAFLAWRNSRATVLFALTSVPIVWALRIARELYGRPTVGVTGWIEVVLTCLVGLGLLYGLRHRDPGVRVFLAFLTAAGSLYQGATMHAVLTRAIALTLLPTPVARVGVVLVFSLGAAALVGTWRVLAERQPEREDSRDAQRIDNARSITSP